MSIEPTIPCPVCKHPILVRYIDLPEGNVARVYTDPVLTLDESVVIHAHQQGDVDLRVLH